MNYMPEIVKLLGVEIGEEFILRNPVNNYTFDKLTYQIDEKGLLEKSKERATRCDTNYTFVKILRGEFEIVKLPKPILDKEEKKYLSRIIRPWKNEVESIRKFKSIFDGYEFLVIKVKTEVRLNTTTLPYFKKGTMYKGMEVDKEYSLEELGL